MIGDALVSAFDWIQELQGGWPELLGSLAGAAIGLFALMLGALYNARLTRMAERDRERNDKFGIIEALVAEISLVKVTLDKATTELRTVAAGQGDFYIPDPYPGIGIFQKFLDRIELFDEGTIRSISELYSVLDEYCGQLRARGSDFDAKIKGKIVMIAGVPLASSIAALNEDVSRRCNDVVADLRFQCIKNRHLLTRLER
ncbi:hypothetical protein HFN63_23255 [Rhizobium leguminosarum]|uniref:hypothetical protein n=1 Tax=Rhizobium leguminosarum TaxID=384 RepID=UPI001C94E053|nr:hypothetical protein [Rhizobium leguminosarum]MBY5772992.1 hypothetical protein [Rhizobium leguminosarum]